METIKEMTAKQSEKEEEYQDLSRAKFEMAEKLEDYESQIKELKHSKELTINRYEEKVKNLEESHKKEISQLERGFQETLLRNNRKIEDLEVMRNNYVKKNASLTKDVKRLIQQLQSSNHGSSTMSLGDTSHNNHNSNNVTDSAQFQDLQRENYQLKEELTKKSHALVDALRALAYVHADSGEEHDDAQKLTHSIEARNALQKLSHLQEFQGTMASYSLEAMSNETNESPNPYGNNNQNSGDIFDLEMSQSDTINTHSNGLNDSAKSTPRQEGTPNSMKNLPNDLNETNSQDGHESNDKNDGNDSKSGMKNSKAKLKLSGLKNRLKTKELSSKMKLGLSKGITSVKEKMKEQSLKAHVTSPGVGPNGFPTHVRHGPSKRATKTKQQLSTHVKTLQALANELSVTIEQKEEVCVLHVV